MEPLGMGLNYFLKIQEPPCKVFGFFFWAVGQFSSIEIFNLFKGVSVSVRV
jgi:hypothetical protein